MKGATGDVRRLAGRGRTRQPPPGLRRPGTRPPCSPASSTRTATPGGSACRSPSMTGTSPPIWNGGTRVRGYYEVAAPDLGSCGGTSTTSPSRSPGVRWSATCACTPGPVAPASRCTRHPGRPQSTPPQEQQLTPTTSSGVTDLFGRPGRPRCLDRPDLRASPRPGDGSRSLPVAVPDAESVYRIPLHCLASKSDGPAPPRRREAAIHVGSSQRAGTRPPSKT